MNSWGSDLNMWLRFPLPPSCFSGLDIKGEMARYRAGLASAPVAGFSVMHNKHMLSLEDLGTLEEQNWLNDQVKQPSPLPLFCQRKRVWFILLVWGRGLVQVQDEFSEKGNPLCQFLWRPHFTLCSSDHQHVWRTHHGGNGAEGKRACVMISRFIRLPSCILSFNVSFS